MPRIVIDVERCKGCALCTQVCPKGDLVQMSNEFNSKGYRPSKFVDPEKKCIGCAFCANMCPDVAITVYR